MMAAKTWTRPGSVPFPNIWSTFSKTDKNGTMLNFEIQDITDDLFPACIEHMTMYFLPDEPMYTSLNFLNDPVSISEHQEWWKNILPERMSLVCIKKDPHNKSEPQIVGFSLQCYHHKSHDNCNPQLEGEKLKTICNIVKYIEDQTDRYNSFGIDEYMDGFGLSVHPDFRCMGIGIELLKARCSIGKAIGLKISITVFTAIASQKAAVRAGYKDIIEIPFSKLSQQIPPYLLNVKNTPTVRYMYLLFT